MYKNNTTHDENRVKSTLNIGVKYSYQRASLFFLMQIMCLMNENSSVDDDIKWTKCLF